MLLCNKSTTPNKSPICKIISHQEYNLKNGPSILRTVHSRLSKTPPAWSQRKYVVCSKQNKRMRHSMMVSKL